MDRLLQQVHQAARRPGMPPALHDPDGGITPYQELVRRVEALQGALAGTAGHVVLIPRDLDVDAVAAFLAACSVGAAPCLAGSATSAGHLGAVRVEWVADDPTGARLAWPAAQPLQAPPGTGYVALSSGSTGRPKAVPVAAAAVERFLDTCSGLLDSGVGARWMETSAAGHDMATVNMLVALHGGGTLVPLRSRRRRFLPGRSLVELSVTHWRCVPRFLELVPPAELAGCLHGLSVLACGGDALPQPLARRVAGSLAPGTRFYSTYGTSETPGFVALLDTADRDPSTWAHGVAPLGGTLPGWELAVAWRGGAQPAGPQVGREIGHGPGQDRDQAERARGGSPETELVVHGDALPSRYLAAEAGQASGLAGGDGAVRRFHTGDRVAGEVGGDLAVVGRLGRVVKRRGEWVDLAATDRAATTVLGCSCYSLVTQGRVVMVVEVATGGPGPGPGEREVRRRLRAALPLDALPDDVRAVPRLPRTAGGKVDARALRTAVGPRGPVAAPAASGAGS